MASGCVDVLLQICTTHMARLGIVYTPLRYVLLTTSCVRSSMPNADSHRPLLLLFPFAMSSKSQCECLFIGLDATI